MLTVGKMCVVSSVCSDSSSPHVLEADEAVPARVNINQYSSAGKTWADALSSSNNGANATALKISTARVTKRAKKKCVADSTGNEAAALVVVSSLPSKTREETLSSELSTTLPLSDAVIPSTTIPLGFVEKKCLNNVSLNLEKGLTINSGTAKAKDEERELMSKKEMNLSLSEVNGEQDKATTSVTFSVERANANAQPASTTVTKLPKNSTARVGSHVTTISTQMSIETLRALRQYGSASLRCMNGSLCLPTTQGAAGASKFHSSTSDPLSTFSASRQNNAKDSTEILEKCVSSEGSMENHSSSNCSLGSNERRARFALSQRGGSSALVHVPSQTVPDGSATGDHGGVERVKDADVRTNLHDLKERNYSVEGRYESEDAMLTPNTTYDSLPSIIEAAAKEEEETRDLLTSVLLRYCRSSEAFSAASAKRMKIFSQSVESEEKANFFTARKNVTVRNDESGAVPYISNTAPSATENNEEVGDTASKWSVSQVDVTNIKSETENTYSSKRDKKSTGALLSASIIKSFDEVKAEGENEKEVEHLPSPLPPTPELVLFEELVELLTTRNVSADLLDLVRELLSRTKVIPHYHHSNTTCLQQQNLSIGSLASAIKGRCHGEKGRSCTVDSESGIGANAGNLFQQQQQKIHLEEVGRRECAQQLILILLNQMKEKKIQESMGIEMVSTETIVKRVKEALKVATISALSYLPSLASLTSPATATPNDTTPIFSTSVSSVNTTSPMAMSKAIQMHCHEALQKNNPQSFASPTDFAESVLGGVSMMNLSDEKNCSSSDYCSPSVCVVPEISPWLSPSVFSTSALPLETHHNRFLSSHLAQQNFGKSSYGFSVPAIRPGSVPVAVHTTAACTRLTRFGVQQFSSCSTASSGAPQYPESVSTDHSLSPFSSLFRPPAPFFSAGSLMRPENKWEMDSKAQEYDQKNMHGLGTEYQICTSEEEGASCLPSKHELCDQKYSPFVPLLPFTSVIPPPCSVSGSTLHHFSSCGYPLGDTLHQNLEKVPLACLPTAYNPFARPLRQERCPSSYSTSSASSTDPFFWNSPVDGGEWWNDEIEESETLTKEKSIEKPNVSSPRHSTPVPPTLPHHQDSAFSSPSLDSSPGSVHQNVTDNCIAWNVYQTPVNAASSLNIVDHLPVFLSESQVDETEIKNRDASVSCTQCSTPQELRILPNKQELQKNARASITSPPSEERFKKQANGSNTNSTKMLSFFLEENSDTDRGEAEEMAWQNTTLNFSMRREVRKELETDVPYSTEALPIVIPSFSPSDPIVLHAAPVAVVGANLSVAPPTSSCQECVSPHTSIDDKTSSAKELHFSPCSTAEIHRDSISGNDTFCDHPVQNRTEFTESFALPLPPSMPETSLSSSAIAKSMQVDCQIPSLPLASFHDSLCNFTLFSPSMNSPLQTSHTYENGFNSTLCDSESKFCESGTTSLSPLLLRSSRKEFTALSPSAHCSSGFEFSLDHSASSRQSREQIDLCVAPEKIFGNSVRPATLDAELSEKNKSKMIIKMNYRETMVDDKKQQQKTKRESSRNQNGQEIIKQGMTKVMCEKNGAKQIVNEEVLRSADALHSKNTSIPSPSPLTSLGNLWNVEAQDFVPSFSSLCSSKNPPTLLSCTGNRTVSRKNPTSFTLDSNPAIRPSTTRREKRCKVRNLPINSSSVKLAFLQSLDANNYNNRDSEKENKKNNGDIMKSTVLRGDNNSLRSSTPRPTQRRKVPYGEAVLLHRVADRNSS